MAYDRVFDPCRLASSGPVARWALRGLIFVALGSAGYLAWVSFQAGDAMLGCGGLPQLDCEHVLTSRWAVWLGMPVSVPAVGVYAAMFVATFLLGPRLPTPLRRAATAALMLLALLAAGAALWFVVLLTLVVGEPCLWCLVVHTCGLTCAGLILLQASARSAGARQQSDAARADLTALPVRGAGSMVALAGVGVAVLIVGQWLFPPPKRQIEQFDRLRKRTRRRAGPIIGFCRSWAGARCWTPVNIPSSATLAPSTSW